MMSVLTIILYVLKDAVAVCSLLMIMRFIFLDGIKLDKLRILMLASLSIFNAVFGVLFLMNKTEDSRAIMDLVSNVLYIVSLQLLTDNKKLSKTIWLTLFCCFTVDMMYSLVSPFLKDVFFIECIFNIVVFAAVGVMIAATTKTMQINFLPEVFAEIPRWIFAVIMLFELTCYYKEFGISASWYSVLYIISSMAVILCVLYLIFKIFYIAHRQNDILKQMALQKAFGEKAASDDKELMRFRHDYKNHMIVVNSYLESGKVDEARKYLEQLNCEVNGVINKIKTGNFVSDAILNYKSVYASQTGVDLFFMGFIPSEGINNEDLCTVLSNLVDNAIEAAQKVEGEKFVEIESKMKNDMLIMSVSNPTVNSSATKLKTTKQDKKNHGFGIKNVERALKKYDGQMTVECENGIFTVNVMMTTAKDQSVTAKI